MRIHTFIEKWSRASVRERQNFQSFFSQLCRCLDVAVPDEDRPGDPDYCFEKPIRLTTSRKSAGKRPSFVDVYRRGCFAGEAKQTDKIARRASAGGRATPGSPASIERLMREAKLEAAEYAQALPERPPFLLVMDVGRALEIWANFDTDGGVYTPFLIGGKHRIRLEDLEDPELRRTLARLWTDPLSLNRDSAVAGATSEMVTTLGRLVQSIAARSMAGADERDRVQANAAVNKAFAFVSDCVFAMFLDSAGLLKCGGFRRFLEDYRDQPARFPLVAAKIFERFGQGGHCAEIRQDLPRFQSEMFSATTVPDISSADLEVLIEAAKRDWSEVRPALFGRLREMVMDQEQRSAEGMHFTDPALVETVVSATVMEPLRAEWTEVEDRALQAVRDGDDKAACRLILSFHRRLCAVRVLDPACGTGNFLYVSMNLMKVLEQEVLSMLGDVGDGRAERRINTHVRPEQFIGLEKDGVTARIASMVMIIGQVQSFARAARGVDCVPVWDGVDIRLQDALLRFHGSEDLRGYQRGVTARPWPEVDFIVGNPPFLGGSTKRRVLGNAYVDALDAVREGRFRKADFATCWWDRAARVLARDRSRLRRFGFIMPASVTQEASREVLAHHLTGERPMRVTFAIPDLAWKGLPNAASVRVAVTVVERGAPNGRGRLLSLRRSARPADAQDRPLFKEQRGDIAPDLTLGLDIARAAPLRANQGLASRGVQPVGAGFVISAAQAARLAALSEPNWPSPVRRYCNGRDLAGKARNVQVIDLFGWDEEEVRQRHPGIYEHLLATVKSGRDINNRSRYQNSWWVFGEPRAPLRKALKGLSRYIVTVEIGKHRWFRFLDADILPDNRLVCVASDDPFILGVLSSRPHAAWAAATGGFFEDRPIYAKTACFDRFPFPEVDEAQRAAIGELAERLDAVRTEVIERWPDVSMTRLYNERQAADDLSTTRDKGWRARARIDLINGLHDQLDLAVIAAYGWTDDIDDRDMVARLTALNRERCAEENEGRVAWLRPDYQTAPGESSGGGGLSLPPSGEGAARAVLKVIGATDRPVAAAALARRFNGPARTKPLTRIKQVLSILEVGGTVRRTAGGWSATSKGP